MEVTAPKLQFDPGGYNEGDSMLLCVQAVVAAVSTFATARSVFREGTFEIAGHVVHLYDVLYDSGALQRSYINRDLVEFNRDKWESGIQPYKTTVALADQTTRVSTDEIVRGILDFTDKDGNTVRGEIEAVVWKMAHTDFILGLPDLLRYFLDLFIDMLRYAREEMLAGVFDMSDMKEGEVRVYSEGDQQEAPEDAETPVPVHFGPVLSFMEVPYDEARAEYLKMLDERIGPLLQGCEELRAMLVDELGMDRFVLKEWNGIVGFEPDARGLPGCT